ncbi:OmpL47-type beta-barrel domain-containing protein [Phytohabitans suffuscus]|uniref:OmpL47-type beta-barrel domain-containing protein n=1 Tax=Phytohabitans suffuscus TaxID=624315 RepID=UPI00156707B2|nr:chitobiase/beta-hexosaminidase C-terminal domain-containing protein [Phytohabitans suffuscus]
MGYSLWELNVYGTPTDTTAPSTEASLDGPGAGGWFTGPATVTLTASDEPGGSGLASTEYQVDGAAAWTVYNGPFEVAGDGVHEVRFRSTDAAGNVEALRSAAVKVDGTGPATAVSGVAHGGVYGDSQDVRIAYEAVDPTSGIATTAGTMNGAPYPSGRLQPLYDLGRACTS